MKMSTLGALMKGDLKNAMISETPGGIEAQEKEGQMQLVASDRLPLSCPRDQLEQMGIVFREQDDDLFIFVTLPEGWRKVATQHDMWSHLIDDKGRKRASIFYKAAFYDRIANMGLEKRYYAFREPEGGYGSSEPDAPHIGVVKDQGKIIWTTETRVVKPDPESGEDAMRQFFLEQDRLSQEATNWLSEHYPDYNNPLAYWD